MALAEDTILYTYLDTLLGRLLLVGNSRGLTHINFCEGVRPLLLRAQWRPDSSTFAGAIDQLRAYFAGELRAFDLPLAPQGTAFQLDVWRALQAIPYGETTSYGELAHLLGRPKGARAVGAANGRNPLPIVIPCHRVVGSDGSLTGYGAGIQIKEALLALESKVAAT